MSAIWPRLHAKVRSAALQWRYRSAVKMLREEISKLVAAGSSPGEASTFWSHTAAQICRRICTNDPCRFLQWPEIRYTMFVHDAAWSGAQAARLQQAPDFKTRWKPALREHALGQPEPSRHVPGSSNNALHMAHHLLEFESRTGTRPEEFDAVVELGGGYGCFCRRARQLGFGGPYLILDLPHLSALQRFYLNGVGVPVFTQVPPAPPRPGVVQTVNDVAQAQSWIGQLAPSAKILFVATWSLSECPLAFRASILPLIERSAALLLAYQSNFEGLDNLQYFATLEKDLAGLFDWHHSSENLPPENFYLIARRSRASTER